MTPLVSDIRRTAARRTPRPRGRPGRSILAVGLVLGGLAAAGAPLTAAAQVDDRPVVAAEAPPFEVLTLAVPTTDRPVGLGDTRSTTTSSPPRDSTTTTAAPRDPPPRDTTTTKPARDRP